MSKISNFVERYRVVSQIKGIDYLIPEIYFFCPHNVTGRHNDVINDVKITLLAITPILIVMETSYQVYIETKLKAHHLTPIKPRHSNMRLTSQVKVYGSVNSTTGGLWPLVCLSVCLSVCLLAIPRPQFSSDHHQVIPTCSSSDWDETG